MYLMDAQDFRHRHDPDGALSSAVQSEQTTPERHVQGGGTENESKAFNVPENQYIQL